MQSRFKIETLNQLEPAERDNLENFARACGLTPKAALEIRLLLSLVGVDLPRISGRRED
jgi:hypothetical protein